MTLTSLAIAFGFSFIHISSKFFKLRLFTVNQFTSFVGGISLAYVFFYLIPTVQSYEHEVMDVFHLSARNASNLIFGSILAGIVLFYFLELGLKSTRLKFSKNATKASGTFWAHMGAYTLYNFLIGMLLSSQAFESPVTALFFLLAIGIHFLTNDWVLRHHFREMYDRYGLKILIGGILLGYLISANLHPSHTWLGLLEAFITGGLILNAIKDELTSCRGNGLTSFIAGLSLYSILLLSM